MNTHQNLQENTDSSMKETMEYPKLIQKMTKPISYINLGSPGLNKVMENGIKMKWISM